MKRTKRFAEGGDVPEGGRFAKDDSDIYRRAREAVLRQQLDEQFGERPAARRAPPAARATDTGDETARLRKREITGTPSVPEDVEARLRAQALESVTPEEYAIAPARLLRAGAAAAKSTALAKPTMEATYLGRVERAAPMERIGVRKPRLLERSPEAEGAKVQNLPPSRSGPAGATEKATTPKMLGSTRGGPSGTPLRRGPKVPVKRAAPSRKEPPRDLDEGRMAGEGPGFRKGGSVGVSRRADGIAQRGKTRGRYI